MTDYLHEMLQKSIDREAKKIVSSGATEEDRYGHLLDSVKGRDIDKEEADSYHERLANIQKIQRKAVSREKKNLLNVQETYNGLLEMLKPETAEMQMIFLQSIMIV